MFQKNKKKFRKWFGKKKKRGLGGLFSKSKWSHKKNQKHMKNHSTFDPKIHKMSPHGLGYQMKDDVKTDEKNFRGSVLKHLFNKWGGPVKKD